MSTPTFSPGFRCSAFDIVVLIAGAAGCAMLIPYDLRLAMLVGWTVGHFFLFCNVFRMSRGLELLWSAVFVALCLATFQLGRPHWLETAAFSCVTTVIVVMIEMRRPSYHGAGWRAINPNLPGWWKQRHGTSAL